MSGESYRFVVSGRVQGVFFRQSTADQARLLNLRGWVRNRSDGCVEGVVGGRPDPLEQLRQWLRQGPPAARVEQVDWTASGDELPAGFEVRR